MASDDPQFEEKAADIIGLYLNPPQNAAVFCAFLVQHPNVQFHFTPTYSSWLNQVESWFSRLQREVIDRGIFTSVADLQPQNHALHPALSENRQAVPLETTPIHASGFLRGSDRARTAR